MPFYIASHFPSTDFNTALSTIFGLERGLPLLFSLKKHVGQLEIYVNDALLLLNTKKIITCMMI